MFGQQLDLLAGPRRATPRAVVRVSDPDTSRQAAARVNENPTKLRASQARVLNIFKAYGDLTDEQLIEYLHDVEDQLGIKRMSPSGARSRRSELSKPNEDRVREIARELRTDLGRVLDEPPTPADEQRARAMLRAEGFRSTLWATGKITRDGRSLTVWGIAR